MSTPYDSFTFTHAGRTFTAALHWDSVTEAPWEHEDGHGPVSDWTIRDGTPGERVLNDTGYSIRYYDFAGAVALAKRDGWGLSPADLNALTARLGRAPTPAEIATQAAEQDFARLKAWCDDQWHWCGVVVTCDDEPDMEQSVWGIESDSPDYHREVAGDLAAEITARLEARDGEVTAALMGIACAAAGIRGGEGR